MKKETTLPALLPECKVHGQMMLRPGQTSEQRFCGIWYKCPQCANTVLLLSKELQGFLKEQAA